MKKGFTLIELLLVISILAIAATSCVISFNNSDKESDIEELKTRYKDIQRGAILFVDLNDINLANFTNSKVVTVTFSDIKKYLSRGNSRAFKNPVTGEDMPSNYLVEITMSDYKEDGMTEDKKEELEYVKSCIMTAKIKTYGSGDTSKTLKELTCIANQNGDECECCNFETVGAGTSYTEELKDANGKATGYYLVNMDGEEVSMKNYACK